MAKFTSADVLKVAERLRRAKGREHPAHFLIGAGCSISAGIPTAKELIQKIHADYPAECSALTDDKRHVYGACMALLSTNERRDLIRPYLAAAKINWGTIVLAQLIAEGFVERVLTVNFDLVLENACGLLGLQPAVYDFGVAPASDPAMIVSPAIVHLHGQSYGLVLLNTDEETRKHQIKLQPILIDTLRNAPLVVIGYSGSADGISQNLLDEFEGREPLYWVGYADELASHLHGFRSKDHFHFLGGADFDRFMIELAQSLKCWPPYLFSDPLGHLLKNLSPVLAYPTNNFDSAIDLLADLRRKLESWQHQLTTQEKQTASLQALYMKGDYEGATKLYSSVADRASTDDREIAYWAFIGRGNQLLEQVKRTSSEEMVQLLANIRANYEAAVPIKRDNHVALNNLGQVFRLQASHAKGEEAVRLYAEGEEKYREALASKSDYNLALTNWGALLCERAISASDEEAPQLFAKALEKFATALANQPDDHEGIYGVGAVQLQQAKQAQGMEAESLFAQARERLLVAASLVPSKTYNLACLDALTGNERSCRQNLENAEQHGTLPRFEHLATDSDLDAVRDKSWFQDLLNRQKR